MYSLAIGNYTADEIDNMLRSDRTVFYEYYITDKDEKPLGKISAEGSIDYNATAAIQRSASLQLKDASDIDFFSNRIKPFMCLETPDGVARFPLGVFLPSSPVRQSTHGVTRWDVECYDKTQILSDDRFPSRYRIAAGTNYIAAISNILASAGIANARLMPSDLDTVTDIEFSIGTSKLTAINTLLQGINYNNIYADAAGTMVAEPYADPYERAINATYAADKRSITFSGSSDTTDFFDAPNQVIRYVENADRDLMISIYTNDDPGSKLSTVSRGRTITDTAAVSDIANQATLDAYTIREATERKIYRRISFSTAVMPNHENLDCIYIMNKDLDVAGKYIEYAWNIDMRTGGRMTHNVRKAVSI